MIIVICIDAVFLSLSNFVGKFSNALYVIKSTFPSLLFLFRSTIFCPWSRQVTFGANSAFSWHLRFSAVPGRRSISAGHCVRRWTLAHQLPWWVRTWPTASRFRFGTPGRCHAVGGRGETCATPAFWRLERWPRWGCSPSSRPIRICSPCLRPATTLAVNYEDQDFLCTRGLLVLVPEMHGEHKICVHSEFSIDKALSKHAEERGWHLYGVFLSSRVFAPVQCRPKFEDVWRWC